ncbi:hypothetical protein EMCRGX_G012125 [Ephydatia muelleri]
MCHPKTGPLRKTRHPGGRSKANSIIGYIKGIAPPNCLPDASLASQLNTVMEQLLCSVCLDVLCQPLELPCRALVCTMCTVQLFRAFNCNDVKCPCCYSETPVIPSELKPAPPLVQALLINVMVHCITCTRDMRASLDGFDAVSVQNVGSTYIIVSWDLPTHSNGILINFSLYCNGALAGVPAPYCDQLQQHRPPPLHFVHVHVLQSRPQALHSSWNVVLGVISAAASLPRHKRFHTLFDLLKYGLMSKYNVMCSSLDPMEELTATPAGAGCGLG